VIRSILGAAAAVCVIAAAPALADYKSEYKAYMAAINSGDAGAALNHGEAAWRQAEAEIGDNATTAILAYNYAVLAADVYPAKGVEAFNRAIELAETPAFAGAIPLQEALMRRAETRVRAEPDNDAFAKDLEALLSAADAGDATMIEAQAMGWRSLAAIRISEKKLDRARKAADVSVALSAKLDSPDPRLQREALFLAGLARIAGDMRTEQDVAEAIALFDRSALLFPPQRDIDHFDPLLAQAIAWRQSVKALAESYGGTPTIKLGSRLPDGEDLKAAYERADAKSALEEEFFWETPHPEICRTADIWSERKPPSYPTRALRKGGIGAILVGYDVDGTGVSRTVVLADFTEAGFGAAAVASMKDWRLKPGLDPACWKNLTTIFMFVLN
jgi:hypothetical protein